MIGWIGRQLNRLPKSWAFWLVIAGLILSGLGMYFGWGWLRSGATEKEPNSTTIRNAGIVIAGFFALAFALWRGLVAERQAAASQRQAETAERQAETALRQTETAQRQVETAQKGLLNERYQRGAEMLGSGVLSVRLGGIYALQHLAAEAPEQYHIDLIQLFCACVRDPIGEVEGPVLRYEEDSKPVRGLREDVQAVMYAIGRRSYVGIALEKADRNFRLDLRNVNLQRSNLRSMKLSHAFLENAIMFSAALYNADLSDAFLKDADLSDAYLLGTNLSNANLNSVVLSGAQLDHAILCDAFLYSTNLSSASLCFANLSRAKLYYTNLTGADLEDAILTGASCSSRGESGSPRFLATGLTQGQLDVACSDPDNPPNLEGVLDAETGKQLVWQGRSCEEKGEES